MEFSQTVSNNKLAPLQYGDYKFFKAGYYIISLACEANLTLHFLVLKAEPIFLLQSVGYHLNSKAILMHQEAELNKPANSVP